MGLIIARWTVAAATLLVLTLLMPSLPTSFVAGAPSLIGGEEGSRGAEAGPLAVGAVEAGADAGPFAWSATSQHEACRVYAFAADQWRGGFYRGDSQWYGRPWVAVYGARSDYPQATLTVALSDVPVGQSRLTVDGLDDELAGKTPIRILVNGTTVYTGESPFAGWDGSGQGQNAPWTTITVTIPEGVLGVGLNRITFANLAPRDNFSAPPYILLGDAVLTVA